ncbi:MAG: extracellular solute-binding protein family 3 [Polaromonas sp.]|nr:extracellular solute-binding protein family 3 [Polaromonas sp.]
MHALTLRSRSAPFHRTPSIFSLLSNPTMNLLPKIAAAAGILLLTLASAQAQNKELVVASSATYRPFAYENPNKEIVGYDVDIIKAVAQKAGLQIKVVNTPWSGIFAALNNGDVDLVISGVTINDKRKQSYDFTAPYFEARQLIAVSRDSGVKSLKDLAGKKIGVVNGSTGDDIASREFGKTNPDIRRFESTPVVISELVNTGLDAAIGDNGVIAFRVQEHKQLKTISDPSFPKEFFGIVVKQGNKALLDKLNAGLAAVKADGSYAQIYRKWFQADAPALPAQ